MTATRTIEAVIPPPPYHMVGDGFRVHNFFPSQMSEERMSPFYLMDYASKHNFAPSEKPRGVSVHPHRGFETVTIAYHGRIAHHDSHGNKGIIGEGDVQWMTAGSGVLHKEYHEKEFSRKGGTFQMVQLWVNLPAKDKMTAPAYQPITAGQMGKYTLPGDAGSIDVIAGTAGVKGPAKTFTPIILCNIKLKKNKSFSLPLPKSYNAGLLVVEGSVKSENKTVATDHFILFRNDGNEIFLEASEDAVLLLLAGEPINEPISAYGPFLMNTETEINQAIEDVKNGKFGYLEE